MMVPILVSIDSDLASNYIPALFSSFLGGRNTALEQVALLPVVESIFRILLGLRFLSSGISNVRRWPHATQTAGIVFTQGAYFFGFVATALMVLGGGGLTLGFQTPISAFMLVIFLLPTFKIHHHRLQVLPDTVRVIKDALGHEEAKDPLRFLARLAFHAQETGWQNNLVFLAATLFFSVRGCLAFGLDNMMNDWVIRLF
jgi:uncharacterized membrane protein YphA (DoxX/SURF4 family)